MKIAGVILMALVPICWGIFRYTAMEKKKKLLCQICQLILTVREQMRFSMKEVQGILSFALEQPQFSLDCKKIIKTVQNQTNRENMFLNLSQLKLLSEEEAILLADFFANLGINDIKGQIKHCEYYYEQFQKLFVERERECGEKSRLILGLSFSLGLAVFIVFI